MFTFQVSSFKFQVSPPVFSIPNSKSIIPPPGRPGGWVCLQLGSREHYAIPRALAAAGRLHELITDAWVPPGSAWRWMPGKLADRWHADLARSPVCAFTVGRVAFDVAARVMRRPTWDAILRRNHWFQRGAVARMATICDSQSPPGTVFSYSYTARLPFREAKRRGMRCVLGQIDPGPIEHDVVEQHVRAAGEPGYIESRPPAVYWEEWREEVALADTIIVNSAWSAQLLEQAGVSKDKLMEIPLVYEAIPANW